MGEYEELHVIINPYAGNGIAGRRWKTIRKILKNRSRSLKENFTRRVKHACEIARDLACKKVPMILSVGGDGTFNEIVNGLMMMPLSQRPELIMLPLGSGRDFSRTLKISSAYHDALTVIDRYKTIAVDVGQVSFKERGREWHRYFVNVLDVGLGGLVVRISEQLPKNLGGFAVYMISSLSALVCFRPVPMKIFVDDQLVDEGKINIVGAANGQFFGGGMHIAPMAAIDDGFLEILYVKEPNLIKFVERVLMKVYQGRHLEYNRVYYQRAQSLKIVCQRTMLVEVDGELEKASEIGISIIPRALKIRVPD